MMFDFAYFLDRYRVHLGLALVGLSLLGFAVWLGISVTHPKEPLEIVKKEALVSGSTSAASTQSAQPILIAIDVGGAVNKPGVYELNKGSRVKDALDRSEGLSSTADEVWVGKNLNLAAILSDGDKLYIPNKEETKKEAPVITSQTNRSQPQASSVGVVTETLGLSTTKPVEGAKSVNNCQKVNINTASVATLDECLPGIGPAYAQRIVDYREASGSFVRIEDIKNVRGIGEATFNKIKDIITIN